MTRLQGKVALVTGAASGMGRAIAERLASEGATVHGLDVNADGLAETAATITAGGDGSFHSAIVDLRAVEGCRTAVTDCVAAHGRLDILGNVAGVHPIAKGIDEVTEDDWNLYNDVNIKAVYFLCQAALPHLLESEGSIVNIASNAGIDGLAYGTVYCATKGAVVQLTKALAMEFIKKPVRINAIAPGGTETALVNNFSFGKDIDFDLIGRYTGMRPMAQPSEIAALFAFLVSDEAPNIHGSILSADSGMTAG